MDYYASAWLLYLLLAVLVNVSVFFLLRLVPLMLRSVVGGFVFAMAFSPTIVESDYGHTFAPFVAQLAIDIIAGKLSLGAVLMPLLVFVVVFGLAALALYKVCSLNSPVSEVAEETV